MARKKQWQKTALGFLLLSLALGAVSAESPIAVVAKIRSGLKELSAIENATPVYKCHYKLTSKGEVIREDDLIIKQKNKSLLISVRNNLFLLSNDFFVCLEKSSKQGEWVLVKASRTNPVGLFKNSLGFMASAAHPLICTFSGETLMEILDDPTFQAKSVSDRQDGLIELGFHREVPSKDGSPKLPLSGVMVLSPKNHFAVTQWQQTLIDPKIVSYPYQSQFTRQMVEETGSLRCKRIHAVALNGSTGEELSSETLEFYPLTASPLDPAELTLAYYNIALPNEAPEDNLGTWWGWYVLVAGIFLTVSFGFWRLAGRGTNH